MTLNSMLVGAVSLVVAVAMYCAANRYEVITGGGAIPMRMDRWTGQTWKLHGDGVSYQWEPLVSAR